MPMGVQKCQKAKGVKRRLSIGLMVFPSAFQQRLKNVYGMGKNNCNIMTESSQFLFAIQKFRNESTKIKNMHFLAIFEYTPKKVISLTFVDQAKILWVLKRNIQIPPPLSTDWHPNFFLGFWHYFEGLKWGFHQKISTFFASVFC